MTSQAMWRVGRVTRTQQKRTLELVKEVKKARIEVEEAAKTADITSVRLRRMAGELIKANYQALEDAAVDDKEPHR